MKKGMHAIINPKHINTKMPIEVVGCFINNKAVDNSIAIEQMNNKNTMVIYMFHFLFDFAIFFSISLRFFKSGVKTTLEFIIPPILSFL